ncbi:periplasmic nitrate reductase cytochrome c protein [Azospirillaceae bacterium]
MADAGGAEDGRRQGREVMNHHVKPPFLDQFFSVFERIGKFFLTPSAYYSLGAILLYGFIAGVVFWGGFHWAIEFTNTEKFCLSCHEHQQFVYPEYQATKHYINATGIRAICTDCHVPRDWAHKVLRKIYVTNELVNHWTGSISTKEKFENKRLEMAQHVWATMKDSDSRECRNCHQFEYMDIRKQESVASRQHKLAGERGATCIDCHKGVTHRLPIGAPERELLSVSP